MNRPKFRLKIKWVDEICFEETYLSFHEREDAEGHQDLLNLEFGCKIESMEIIELE